MIYKLKPYAMQSIAAPGGVATGTAILTLLQFKLLVPAKIIEWGISFDGSSAATPGKVELIQTDVAATVTAMLNADIDKIDAEAKAFNGGDPTAALISVGTAATGRIATAEGAITTVQEHDPTQFIPPTTLFVKQFPLGREPHVGENTFNRIRVTFPVSVNCFPYVVLAF